MYIQLLFNKKDAPAPSKKAPQNKTIKRINQLEQELITINNAYDKSEASLKADYNNKLILFEKYYQAYQDKHKQHSKRLIKDAELKQAEKDIQPYQEALNDAGYTLEQVQGYKKEDILKLVAEIDEMKESFTEALAEEIKDVSIKLQMQKEAYLKSVVSIGELYRTGTSTESTVKKHLNQYNIKYDSHIVKMLEMKSEGLPVLYKHLVLDKEEVIEAMKGLTEYRKA